MREGTVEKKQYETIVKKGGVFEIKGTWIQGSLIISSIEAVKREKR